MSYKWLNSTGLVPAAVVTACCALASRDPHSDCYYFPTTLVTNPDGIFLGRPVGVGGLHQDSIDIRNSANAGSTYECPLYDTPESVLTGVINQVTIDMLPGNVFLDIFEFYVQEVRDRKSFKRIEVWITLVHVCRHWRSVVFESPLRLGLQLLCTDKTPVREMLSIWRPLPICIWAHGSILDVDNIVASLKHNDRICQIVLHRVPNLLLEAISTALTQGSFPALTNLELVSSPGEGHFVLPPGPFSGGSAPLLQHVVLSGIPIPEPPGFLLSSVNNLTRFTIYRIPFTGYISPDAMVTCISAFTNLEVLHLKFGLPHFLNNWENRPPLPPTRSVQPTLLEFSFAGVSKYLEDFVARIDVPQLYDMSITFLDGGDLPDTSQLVQFIYRNASFKTPDGVQVRFLDDSVWFTFSSRTPGS